MLVIKRHAGMIGKQVRIREIRRAREQKVGCNFYLYLFRWDGEVVWVAGTCWQVAVYLGTSCLNLGQPDYGFPVQR